MTRDNNGDTPLHIACGCRHTHIVQYLLSTGKVHILTKNKYGKTPMDKIVSSNQSFELFKSDKSTTLLHLAAAHGWIDTVIDLIKKYKCDTNSKDTFGNTPIHYAASNNHLEVVKYLIREGHCNLSCKNNDGDTPLHIACRCDHLNIAQYLISEAHCDPSCKNNNGDTPLHLACNHRHAHIVQYLVSTGKLDPQERYENISGFLQSDKQRKTRLSLLHLAAVHGWIDTVIDLITKNNWNTNCKDFRGRTPLHYAASNNHLEVVRYLINEQHCDPMTRDNYGETPLHLASGCSHTHIVQYLLSTCKVDQLAKNNNGKTSVDIASQQDNNFDVLKLFQSFSQCEREFPVHTYTKLVLTGYSGAGKTTMSQLILLLANKISWLSSGHVTDIERLTAGIVPLHVKSKVNEVGNMVIYDFAGQQEYYSSHAAVLERIMRNSAAIFVCIVDLSQCMDKISESIHYWISFIENACSSAQGSSHVIGEVVYHHYCSYTMGHNVPH